MGYCALIDITNSNPSINIIQLTDDEGLKVINDARVDAAIEAAGDIINGYLRGRVGVSPLSPVPGLIKSIAVDITIFKLYERRFATEIPEGIQKRYDNAIKMLREIQSGTITLDIETPAADVGHYVTNKTAADREFSKDVLNAF